MHGRQRLPVILLAFPVLAAVACLVSACDTGNAAIDVETPGAPPTGAAAGTYKVFAMNRRGMAFPDADFEVSAIFPPANFLVAQVVKSGRDAAQPVLLDDSQVEVRYSAVMDITGSINSFSSTKTNFWNNVDALYHFYSSSGLTIERDQGVHGPATEGQWMPGSDNEAQLFTRFDPATSTFTAPYVPVTPRDDHGRKNYFPLYNIEAVDKATQKVLASTVVPLPMAEPMRCQKCHVTGGVAADYLTSERFGGLEWSDNPDEANNAKENIAILHSLVAGIDLTIRQPYLCAECHYSPIADPDGKGPVGMYQVNRRPLSISIHAWHALDRGRELPADNARALIPDDGEASCKICHGGEQPYTRGPMRAAGLVCQDCHGGMQSVGRSPLVGAAETRTPFVDEPRCESCHTGDEVSHLGADVVLRQAYDDGDRFATPRLATNRRFAEEPGVLYRSSIGHGGMTCISCHGSPHAEWPVMSGLTHDNEIADQLQGHAGSIVECAACHDGTLGLSMQGPHGLHNVDDPAWVRDHGRFFAADAASCQACHGTNLAGSRLARTGAPRSFALPDGTTMNYARDQPVGCGDCHARP